MGISARKPSFRRKPESRVSCCKEVPASRESGNDVIKIKKTERPWELVTALPGLMGKHQRFLLALQPERIVGLDAQVQQPDRRPAPF